MNKNVVELLWIVGVLFVFMMFAALTVPEFQDGVVAFLNRFTQVTNGNDLTPPSTWNPTTTP